MIVARRCGFGGAARTALLAVALAGCASEPAANPPPGPSLAQAARPYIGVMLRAVEFPPSAASGGAGAGVRLDVLPPGGASEEAGLRENDIVITGGGQPVRSADEFIRIIQETGAGRPLPVVYLRDGQRREATLLPRLRGANADRATGERIATRIAEEERLGDTNAASGVRFTAFSHYVRALQFFHYDFPYDDSDGRIAGLLMRMRVVQPVQLRVPDEAQRHLRRAQALQQDARTPADYSRVFAAWDDALYDAPWLPELWLGAGLAAEKAGQPETARRYRSRAALLTPRS